MKLTVVWTPTAERELAALWVENPQDRAAISRTANCIDSILGADPHTKGESRYDTVRVLLVPPLGVDFDVDVKDRKVYVLSVWYTRRNR